MKILTVLGARPQFIKAAAVSRVFKKEQNITEVIVHTGQHYDEEMSDIFFTELDIPKPDYLLNLGGSSHGQMTGRMIQEIERIVLREKPDYVLVYGDTNSTLAGAIVASKQNCRLAHVEAGLRSFNRRMPEEINRVCTDHVSDVLFCPTKEAVDNLRREGLSEPDRRIVLSGDVMKDAALFYGQRFKMPVDMDGDYVLVTVHRAENTDDPDRISGILGALNAIARKTNVVFPMHPRTKAAIDKLNLKIEFEPWSPVGYLEMLSLIKGSRFVITDSGGLQKEAAFFNKYCLTLRDETEWVELVEAKVNFLVGADQETIMNSFEKLNVGLDKFPDSVAELYGDGNASEVIAKELLDDQRC